MQVEKQISRKLLTVQKPDHPFAFVGPDYLVSDRKGLLAVFAPNKSEEKSINKLLFRLLNSRLAYPSSTKMLLLLSPDTNLSAEIELEGQYFDRIIESKDLKKANTLILDNIRLNSIQELKNVQKKLYRFQSQMQMDNIKHIEQGKFKANRVEPFKQKIKKIEFYNNFNNKSEKSRSNIYSLDDQIVGFKNLTKHRSDLSELSPFYEFVMKSDFQFDNGIPFFKHITKKYLSLNKIPNSRYDPLKPIRIASMFGWFIGNINNEEDLFYRQPKKRTRL